MLRSIGKLSGESVESARKNKKEGCGWNDLQKMKVLSLESSESMEPMKKVPLKERVRPKCAPSAIRS